MARLAWLAVLCAAVLAGCSSGAPDAGAPSPAAATSDPLRLIGSWRLEGADEQGAVLRLAGDGVDLSVFRRCGLLSGHWRADENGLFVGQVSGTIGCPPSELATPEWLARVSRYRVDGDSPVLLDERGAVIARLRAGADPTPVPTYMRPEDAEPPTVTDQARRRFVPAAPLPAGLTPAEPAALVGRWELADPRKPFLEFRVDGSWDGSDGCNRSSGRWVLGPGGAILTVSGPTTLIGCDSPSAPGWLGEARRVAIDGGTLVLVGGDGREVGRLPRAR
jgi:META domain